MTPEQTARLVALPDALRAWAREDARAKLYLGQHVTHNFPLGWALARLAALLGEDGDWEVRRRLLEGQPQPGHFRPFCSRLFPDALRCRLLTTQLVQRAGASTVESCDECAEWYEASNLGQIVRAVGAR